MVRTLIAAAALFLVAAPSAFAHGNDDRPDGRSESHRYEPRRAIGHEWRELHEARERFYSRPHTRWQVHRFERWFAMRTDELRRARY